MTDEERPLDRDAAPASPGSFDRDASSLGAAGDPTGGAPDVLDCRGQRCPLPVIALARRVPVVPVGAVVRVLADDPAAANDIPAWCRLRGQEFLGAVETDGAPGFDVRRVI